MFQASIKQSRLADALDTVSAVVDECKLTITPTKFRIRAVDHANVGMVDLSLPEGSWKTYNASEQKLAVNVKKLEDAISVSSGNNIIKIKLNEETQKLELRIAGMTYTLSLLDPQSVRQEQAIPDLDLNATITVEASELKRGINAASMVSDHATFSFDPDTGEFTISAEGDTDTSEYTITQEDFDSEPAKATSKFSLDYLNDMVPTIPKNNTVTVKLGDELPTKMHYTLHNNCPVTYMIAPRIQQSE